ncbi:LysM peptidoglycan-binding domain-containing protein [Streptomyces lavendulocolor]|uniref:LysM peptidoglycan-binding domain-containing protein n=1 Tax=Streptomyces lavendulocolor TaxID=67316 RepID=A0ABV2WBE5_9ACTN
MTAQETNVTLYTVKTGDTLTSIAATFGTTVAQLVHWNGIPDPDVIKIGQRLVVAKADAPQETFYTVRPGDTLTAIAARYGTTVERLVKWNRISDPDVIKVGQRLVVARSELVSSV